MDYDHILKRPVENLPSTMFRNNFSWITPFHPESLYTNVSGPSSFINPPYCNSEDYSRFANFVPETYGSSDASQSLRYHPYPPMFSPFKGASKYCHSFTDNRFYGPKTAKNCFAVQRDHPKNIGMPSKMLNGIYDEKTHYFRSNRRGKRQKSYKFGNAMLNEKVTAQKVCNNIEANYDLNFVCNDVPNESVYRSNEYENKLSATIGDNYPHKEIIEAENIAKLATNDSSHTGDKNFTPCSSQNPDLTLKSLTDPLVSHSDNECKGNTNIIFTDETTNADKNNFLSGLLDYPLMNIAVAENINCGIPNIKLENVVDSESFKPIFIGKDEIGQDIILLIESDINVSGVKSESDLSVDNKNLVMQNQQAGTNNSMELMTETSPGSQFIEHINRASGNEPGENAIFSHIDSYAAEEVVTSENQYPKSITEKEFTEFTELITKTFSGSQFIEHINTVSNKPGENVIFSTIDSYASEEVVTSEGQYLKSKTEKDKNVMNADKNDTENLKHIPEKKHNTGDFAPEASISSRNTLTSTDSLAQEKRCIVRDFKPQVGTSTENRNTDDSMIWNKIPPSKKIDFQDEERPLKSCFKFDCDKSLRNIQHEYTAHFMKKVKHENEHLSNNEQFWKMYQTIVHEVGSNVMQTMYNVLPRLIKISNDTKAVPKKQSKNTKKCNKKRLKVKIPANTKK